MPPRPAEDPSAAPPAPWGRGLTGWGKPRARLCTPAAQQQQPNSGLPQRGTPHPCTSRSVPCAVMCALYGTRSTRSAACLSASSRSWMLRSLESTPRSDGARSSSAGCWCVDAGRAWEGGTLGVGRARFLTWCRGRRRAGPVVAAAGRARGVLGRAGLGPRWPLVTWWHAHSQTDRQGGPNPPTLAMLWTPLHLPWLIFLHVTLRVVSQPTAHPHPCTYSQLCTLTHTHPAPTHPALMNARLRSTLAA